MSRLTMWRDAEPGERFAPNAFAHTVGMTVPLNEDGRQKGVVVAAVVAEDGGRVEFTFELDATYVDVTLLDSHNIGHPAAIGLVTVESSQEEQ